jgi:hypothetical protein
MEKDKITIKEIFQDHFEEFWNENATKFPEEEQEHINTEVHKMMDCGNVKKGFVSYICTLCLLIMKIGFTCKSRFCSKCGKKYVSQWVEKQVEKLLDVPHRHCVFTIPEEFRVYFFNNKKALKDLQDMSYEVLQEYANNVTKQNRKEYEKKKRNKKGGELWQVAVISVAHTFGRDLGFNPHVHVLVAEIKMKGNEIKEMAYFDYAYFRKVWQYKLINYMIEKRTAKKEEYLNMFKRYPDGFYINAKSKMKSAKGAARYIGRYLGRPAIAEYRIIKYDGENVTFWYEDHKTKQRVELTLTAFEFMGKVLMHIPPKYFKMARTYGIYAGSIYIKIKKCYGLLRYIQSGLKSIQYTLKDYLKRNRIKLTYRELVIKNFSEDPLKCKKCGNIMELWEIWHEKYGYIYDLSKYGAKGVYSN